MMGWAPTSVSFELLMIAVQELWIDLYTETSVIETEKRTDNFFGTFEICGWGSVRFP